MVALNVAVPEATAMKVAVELPAYWWAASTRRLPAAFEVTSVHEYGGLVNAVRFTETSVPTEAERFSPLLEVVRTTFGPPVLGESAVGFGATVGTSGVPPAPSAAVGEDGPAT
jgi:hypothetical protein